MPASSPVAPVAHWLLSRILWHRPQLASTLFAQVGGVWQLHTSPLVPWECREESMDARSVHGALSGELTKYIDSARGHANISSVQAR